MAEERHDTSPLDNTANGTEKLQNIWNCLETVFRFF